MRTHDVERVLGSWSKELNALALSPDGSRFAIAGGAKTAPLYATNGELIVELAHFWSVSVLAFSPDSTRLATGSEDMGVRLFSTDGELIALLKGHTHDLTDLAWHPDGTRLATASFDGSVRTWSGTEPVETLDDLGGAPRSVAWLEDRLVIGTEASVILTGEERRSLASNFVGRLAVSPTGQSLAVLSWLWNDRVRMDTVTLYSRDLELIWKGPARAFVFGADGALALAESESLRVLEPDSARVRFVVKVLDSNIDCLASLANGDWVTGGSDGSARIVSQKGVPGGGVSHSAGVSLCATAGEDLVSVSRDGQCLVWKTTEAKPFAPLRTKREPIFREKLPHATHAVAFSPDGTRVAIGTPVGIEIRDATTGELLEVVAPGQSAWAVEWSAAFLRAQLLGDESIHRVWNGETLAFMLDLPNTSGVVAIADRTLLVNARQKQIVLRLRDGELVRVVEEPGEPYGNSASADGRWVFFAAHAGGRLVDTESGESRKITDARVRRSGVSPDGHVVVIGSDSGTELFDTRSTRGLVALDASPLWSSAWSPNGDRFAIGDSEGCVHLFTQDGTRITRFENKGLQGHDQPMFFPDGSRLTTGGRHGGKASVWRVSDGERIAELGGIATTFTKAIVVNGGTRILTHANVNPAADLTLRLWDRDGEPIASLSGHEGQSFWQVLISPTGRHAMSVIWGDRPRVWSLTTGELLEAIEGHSREIRGARIGPDVAGAVTVATSDGEGNFQLWRL